MHPAFSAAIEDLHQKYERLLAMKPLTAGLLPRDMPRSGVYLFSEGDDPLYVGRSDSLRARCAMHYRLGSPHNQASFAFLLARKATGRTDACYRAGNASRLGLMGDLLFAESFLAAKSRIRAMSYRFVEETDPTRQALLEIYCALALNTPYNSFKTS